MRSIAPRWLAAVAIAGAAVLLLPTLAVGQELATGAPVAEQPAAPPGEVAPVTGETAPAPPVAEQPEAPAAEGPAVGEETPAPVEEVPVEAPAPPPAQTPEGEAAAPSPGAEATPTPSPLPPEVIALPTTTPLPAAPDIPAPPVTPAGERLAAAVAATPAPAVSISTAAPDLPAPSAAAVPSAPDAPAAKGAPRGETIPDFVTTILSAGETTPRLDAAPASVGPGGEPRDGFLASGDEASVQFAPSFQAPIGAAPSGSSLLAVLAGYVLPGSGGAPASTIVLLIVLGLILGVTYGAFPQMTERLAAGRLLGASAGHGLAVRRPG